MTISIGLIRASTHFQEPQGPAIYDGSRTTANVLTQGNVDETVRRLLHVYDLLKANNFDPNTRLTRDDLILPDQNLSDNRDYNSLEASAIIVPTNAACKEVALYTDLYTRCNLRAYQGDVSVPHPEGFYLVVWKTGQAERIPIKDVRRLATGGPDNEFVYVFPGMESYSATLPKHLWVEAAENAGVTVN